MKRRAPIRLPIQANEVTNIPTCICCGVGSTFFEYEGIAGGWALIHSLNLNILYVASAPVYSILWTYTAPRGLLGFSFHTKSTKFCDGKVNLQSSGDSLELMRVAFSCEIIRASIPIRWFLVNNDCYRVKTHHIVKQMTRTIKKSTQSFKTLLPDRPSLSYRLPALMTCQFLSVCVSAWIQYRESVTRYALERVTIATPDEPVNLVTEPWVECEVEQISHYPVINSRRLSLAATYSDPWASSDGTILRNELIRIKSNE